MGQISDFQKLMANLLVLKVSLASLFQGKGDRKKVFSDAKKTPPLPRFRMFEGEVSF